MLVMHAYAVALYQVDTIDISQGVVLQTIYILLSSGQLQCLVSIKLGALGIGKFKFGDLMLSAKSQECRQLCELVSYNLVIKLRNQQAHRNPPTTRYSIIEGSWQYQINGHIPKTNFPQAISSLATKLQNILSCYIIQHAALSHVIEQVDTSTA